VSPLSNEKLWKNRSWSNQSPKLELKWQSTNLYHLQASDWLATKPNTNVFEGHFQMLIWLRPLKRARLMEARRNATETKGRSEGNHTVPDLVMFHGAILDCAALFC
jgi:hypothetical protein